MCSNVQGQNKSGEVWHALWSCKCHPQSKIHAYALVGSTNVKRFPGPKHHLSAFPRHVPKFSGKRVDNWPQEPHSPCMLETSQHVVLKCGLPSHSNPLPRAMLALGAVHQNPKHWPLGGQMPWNSKSHPSAWAWRSPERSCPSCSSSPMRPRPACSAKGAPELRRWKFWSWTIAPQFPQSHSSKGRGAVHQTWSAPPARSWCRGCRTSSQPPNTSYTMPRQPTSGCKHSPPRCPGPSRPCRKQDGWHVGHHRPSCPCPLGMQHPYASVPSCRMPSRRNGI